MPKHIVIDGRIRRASTGRPVDRLLQYIPELDTENRYTVLLEPNDDWKPSSRKVKTMPCKYRQFSFNPWQQVAFSWQLYKLKKPDLVHFTLTPQQPVFYFGRQITFTHDLTMLKFVRAGKLPKWLHKIRMQGYKFLLWQSHRKALKILVPTEYVRDAVAKYHLFTNRKLAVTLEASEPPLPGKPEKPEYAPDEFIMYVGSAFPHKNLDRLIEAFEILKEQHPDLKLVLVGKQEYHSNQLQRWAKKRLYAQDVIFTGFVPDAELKWLYTNAAAYVFPSLSEGFGLPGLEAMVHCCPVVSSDATCLPEVHGDAAVYFNPEDIADIAEKINQVLAFTPKARENLISEGKQQAAKFSWRRMAEQTLAVYKEVLG
jgi:glycosyltransferase involved in cell wall biosynthesis